MKHKIKTISIVVVLMFVISVSVSAFQMNSTNYAISGVCDSAGGVSNSTSYYAASAVGEQILGHSNSASFSLYYGIFYFFQQMQTCFDGTLYGSCSASKPKQCVNGVLIDNCSQCGCTSGQSCNATNGTCYLNCSDGTPYGQCSSTKPKFCNGVLIDNCSYCGCPAGLNCSVFSLTNVSAASVNPGSENIMWNTNAYANSTVRYGTNSSNLNLTASNSTLVAVHLITLTGLNITNTTMIYYYTVTSCDCSGNCNTSNTYNFTTVKPNTCVPYDFDNNKERDIFDVVYALEYLSGERNAISNCNLGCSCNDGNLTLHDVLNLISLIL